MPRGVTYSLENSRLISSWMREGGSSALSAVDVRLRAVAEAIVHKAARGTILFKAVDFVFSVVMVLRDWFGFISDNPENSLRCAKANRWRNRLCLQGFRDWQPDRDGRVRCF